MVEVSKRVIEKLKKRDEKAFDIVYDKYYKLVYYVAYDILKDEMGAEDILQDTFIKLMDNIESYEDNGMFKQYLLRIAKNLALNEYNRRKAHENIELTDMYESYDNHEKIEVILTLDKTLTQEESKIVQYKVLFDYSFQEIADDLNISLGKAQSQYYSAMKKLKNYFLEKGSV